MVRGRHVARAALLAGVAMLAVLGAQPAAASSTLKPGIHDDAQILHGDPNVVFPRLKSLNTKVIRVTLWWGGSSGIAQTEPENPTDPDDPAYDWTRYDRVVRYAGEYGIEVVFTVLGTPTWASGGTTSNVAPTSAVDLRSFVTAAARRYSGSWVADDDELPAVKKWVAWNEPNNPVFLKPQFKQVGGTWVIQSARDYARICNAVVGGVKAGQTGGKVACGATAPRGNNNPISSRPSVSPLTFLSAMRRYGATGFDAFAHHPYYGSRFETPSTRPAGGSNGQSATAVTLGNLDALTTRLSTLYGKKMRIWVTEYGYQTNPPDTLFGVSWAKQAAYLRQAYLKLKQNPRVDMFIWFLLRDETRPGGWESGLFTSTWKAKTARATFAALWRS